MEHRIEQLENRLKEKAFWLSKRHPDLEKDDFYQEMVCALLLKSKSEPSFSEQNDAYLMIFAHWTAIRLGEKGQRYRKYVYREFQVLSKHSEREEHTNDWYFEYIFAPDKGQRVVENEVIRRENTDDLIRIFGQLNSKEQYLVRQLFFGHEQKEIAEEWGVTPPAVTQFKQAMATKFL